MPIEECRHGPVSVRLAGLAGLAGLAVVIGWETK